MAITIKNENVTVNKTYVERVEERTNVIHIEIPANSEPIITVRREKAIYHDDVLFATENSKFFNITIEDIKKVGNVGIMSEIANTIDIISQWK